jgi:hypothetical protein
MGSVYNTLPKNSKINPYMCEISFELLTDTNNQLINTLKNDEDNVNKFSYLTNKFIFGYMKNLYFSKLPDDKSYVGLVTYDLKRSIYVIAYYKKQNNTMLTIMGIDTSSESFPETQSIQQYNIYNTPKSYVKPTSLPHLITNFNMGIKFTDITFNNQNTELIYVSRIVNTTPPPLPSRGYHGGARKYRSKKANKNKRSKTGKTKKRKC